MKKFKLIILLLAIICAAVAIYFVLTNEKALVTHPKGIIAFKELKLIHLNMFLMLSVVIPTVIMLFIVARRYRAKNTKAKYRPDQGSGIFLQTLLWIIPSIVIAIMATITWKATHDLDPYKPLKSKNEPLLIQVIALNWKWLFIYPEEEIATINFVQFPEKRAIHFELCADGSPMNSFWIPQLSGQIYAMTGMITPLYVMADGPGEYKGRAAEINGRGFADMTFLAKSVTEKDFEDWVKFVKQVKTKLTHKAYGELVKPSKKHLVEFYSDVEGDLFNKAVMKYMHPSS